MNSPPSPLSLCDPTPRLEKASDLPPEPGIGWRDFLAQGSTPDHLRFALNDLIRERSRHLFTLAYAILLNGAEAEDVVQDSFVKLYRELVSLRKKPQKILPWLDQVTRNGARDALRRRKPQAEEGLLDLLQDETIRSPEAGLDDARVKEQLRRGLASLTEDYRLVLTLKYLEGLDYREIGSAMGLSQGAVRGLMTRGLAALRNGLSKSPLLREFKAEGGFHS